MRRRWRNLLTTLGLTRTGRVLFSAVAALGTCVAVADDVVPRSGSEADDGPTAAAIVAVWTLVLLVLVVSADASLRFAWHLVRRR